LIYLLHHVEDVTADVPSPARQASNGHVKSVKSPSAHASRRSRSLSSGAHSRDPLARSLHEVVVFQQVRPHLRRPRSGRLEGWTAIPISDSRYQSGSSVDVKLHIDLTAAAGRKIFAELF
jgi:hypothetical protein